MFGIGPQELVVIVLLLLVVFGPGKAVSMARDLGHFVSKARGNVEELKGELLGDDEKDHDEAASSAIDSRSDIGDEVPQQQEEGGEELLRESLR